MLLKFPTGVSTFGKNKDNLFAQLCIYVSTVFFVIGFSRLRPFLISTFNFQIKESSVRLVGLKITILQAPKLSKTPHSLYELEERNSCPGPCRISKVYL